MARNRQEEARGALGMLREEWQDMCPECGSHLVMICTDHKARKAEARCMAVECGIRWDMITCERYPYDGRTAEEVDRPAPTGEATGVEAIRAAERAIHAVVADVGGPIGLNAERDNLVRTLAVLRRYS